MKYLPLIPKDWDELKLSTYIKLCNLLPLTKPDDVDEDDYILSLIEIYFNVFTGESLSEADVKADEFQMIIQRLDYLKDLPTETKSKYKVKNVDTLNYKDFVDFQKLQHDPINNMPAIIKMFSIDEVNVDALSVKDAMVFFCSVRKQLKKLLQYSVVSLGIKAVKLIIKAWLQKLTQWLKMSFSNVGVG